MIKNIVKRLFFPNTYSNDAFIKYLRKNKVLVGENVTIYSPNHTTIDTRKPYLISIGDNCKITKGVTILAHDYSISTVRRVYGLFIGGSLPTSILQLFYRYEFDNSCRYFNRK